MSHPWFNDPLIRWAMWAAVSWCDHEPSLAQWSSHQVSHMSDCQLMRSWVIPGSMILSSGEPYERLSADAIMSHPWLNDPLIRWAIWVTVSWCDHEPSLVQWSPYQVSYSVFYVYSRWIPTNHFLFYLYDSFLVAIHHTHFCVSAIGFCKTMLPSHSCCGFSSVKKTWWSSSFGYYPVPYKYKLKILSVLEFQKKVSMLFFRFFLNYLNC
jgi:hypothetical protein